MCLGSVEGQTEGHYYTPKKELGSLSPLTRGCLLRVSRREPCVSLPFNPPFEMGELASIGFPHRAYSLSAALAPLQRILKRFGAQTLLAVASHFFFFFSVLFGSRAFRPNTSSSSSSSSRQKEALKGLWESAGDHGVTPGLRSPGLKSTVRVCRTAGMLEWLLGS